MKTLHTTEVKGYRRLISGKLGMWLCAGLLGILLVTGLSSYADALIYDSGPLNFSSTGQSMWGSGSGVSINESIFLGTEWTNKTASVGDIAGGYETIPNPEYGVWWLAYQAYKALNPGPAPSRNICVRIPWVGRVCSPNPAYGAWWVRYQAYKAAYPGPAPSKTITIDTRTGAEVNLTTSGRVGIEAGFMLDSGTVDATADFSVTAELPDNMTVEAGTFFNINSSSTFDNGTIDTQSPWIEASLNGVLELSGSVSAQACLALVGCKSGSTSLPTVDYHPEIIALDPNNGLSLFGESLGDGAAGGITVTGDLVSKQIKVETSGGTTLIDNMPESSVEVDLAEIGFQLPNVSTSGTSNGSQITSSGRDNIIDAKLDLDGVVAMATGFTPSADLTILDREIAGKDVTIEAAIDFLDIDVGPTIDLFQDFELTPKLKVDLEFSSAVEIAGVGTVTSYSGDWDSLPDFALFETTHVTPTFWLEATLKNTTGIDFGFELDLAALSAGITASIGDFDLLDTAFGPVWEDTFGLGGRFGGLNLFDELISFQGFNRILGEAFTLFVPGSDTIWDPNTDNAPVPEPGTLLLLGAGLVLMSVLRKRSGRRILPGAIRIAVFAVIVIVSCQTTNALASDDDNRFSIRGVGLLSCEIYETEREAQSPAYQIFGGWIDGYITGVNQYAPDTFDMLSFESSELITELLGNHCKQHPQDLVFGVLNSMVIKLQDDRIQTASPHTEVKDDSRSVRLYEEVLRRIQTRLAEEGHYTGEITGTFGEDEKAALAAFQKAAGLEPTGFPDQVTLWKLLRTSKE